MAAVHHAPVAMHYLRGIDALLSAVSVHFFSGIFSTETHERVRQSTQEFSHRGTVLRKSVGYMVNGHKQGRLSYFIAIRIEVRDFCAGPIDFQ